jgi:hypothetical protein
MYDRNLQDFSHVGNPHDTLEDLAQQHAELKRYSRQFTEPGLGRFRFDGDRFIVISRRLQSLLVDNTTIDGILGRHWRNNTERVMLFDQAYSARTDNPAYREVLREYKRLVANADRVFLVDMALKDSIKKLESHMAYVCYNDLLSNFKCTPLARIFGF